MLMLSTGAQAQQANSCAALKGFKAPGVEITKVEQIAYGTTVPNLYGPGRSAPIPAYCRVEGIIHRRAGVGGEKFGINFALVHSLCQRDARRRN
jgi:hypothetical protein